MSQLMNFKLRFEHCRAVLALAFLDVLMAPRAGTRLDLFVTISQHPALDLAHSRLSDTRIDQKSEWKMSSTIGFIV